MIFAGLITDGMSFFFVFYLYYSILSYLCRGSLYRLIHRPNNQLDERRRLRMALDAVLLFFSLFHSHTFKSLPSVYN